MVSQGKIAAENDDTVMGEHLNVSADKDGAVADSPNQTSIKFWRALTELLCDKPIEQITVTELSERAGFSRKTFYAHYETVDDVRAELQQSIIDNTYLLANRPGIGTDPYVLPAHCEDVLRMGDVGTYLAFFLAVNLEDLDKSGEKLFLDTLVSTWDSLYDVKHDRIVLFAHAVVTAIMQIYQDWAVMKRPLPLDELTEFVAQYLDGAFETLKKMQRPH